MNPLNHHRTFKYRGQNLWDWVYKLLELSWGQRNQPCSKNGNGVLNMWHTKKDKQTRGITLLNGAYMFSSFLYKRLNAYTEKTFGDYLAGFQPNNSTIDHIHIIRQIFEKGYEYRVLASPFVYWLQTGLWYCE